MDLSLVKTGLATLLQKNTMAAMDGIFSQVMQGGREGKGEGVLGYGKGGGVGGRGYHTFSRCLYVCIQRMLDTTKSHVMLSAFCVVQRPLCCYGSGLAGASTK